MLAYVYKLLDLEETGYSWLLLNNPCTLLARELDNIKNVKTQFLVLVENYLHN